MADQLDLFAPAELSKHSARTPPGGGLGGRPSSASGARHKRISVDSITEAAANSPTPQPSDAVSTTGPSILVFPADRRIGKIRDVATKLMAKTTERAIDHYRHQVTEGLLMNLTSKGVPVETHPDQVARFWKAVECEINRQVYGCRPGNGGAA